MTKFRLLILALLLSTGAHLFGYVLEGQSWTLDRTVQMQLSLGAPRPLSDGAASFNDVAISALQEWNGQMAHLQYSWVKDSMVAVAQDDDELSVTFTATIFGKTFGSDVLAVTLLNYRNTVMEDTDTLFNSKVSWDSYRGPLRGSVIDFRRVALHEFGHTLGLDHPDEAKPKQNVDAIMNAHVSDTENLTSDDIAGIRLLYSNGPAYQSIPDAPVLMNLSTRGSTNTGDDVMIGGFIIQGSQPATFIIRALGFSLAAFGVDNPLSDPMIDIYDSSNHVIAQNDDWFTSADASTIASYRLDPPNSIESAVKVTLPPGSYTAIAHSFSSSDQPAQQGVGLVEIYDLRTSSSRAGNVSTRGKVGNGDSIMIGGFVIGGNSPKPLIIRALGPTLATLGVAGALADPLLELRDSNGNLIEANDDWQQSPEAGFVAAAGRAPGNAKESAIAPTLNPGPYTVLVYGVGNTTGAALFEVYDESPAP